MKFRIWTILWVFALLASAMATFSPNPIRGLALACAIAWFWWMVLDESRGRGLTLAEVLLCLLVLIALHPVVFPRITTYEGERVARCRERMLRIVDAALTYRDRYGQLPSNASNGDSTANSQSWRTEIRQFLHFDEGSSNCDYPDALADAADSQAIGCDCMDYCCEDDVSPKAATGEVTSYFAVLGESTAWFTLQSRDNDVTDDPAETILLMEKLGNNATWSDAQDLSFSEALQQLTTAPSTPLDADFHWPVIASFFTTRPPKDASQGFHVAFADGSVRYVTPPLSKELATALLTANGREEIADADIELLWEAKLDNSRIYSTCVFAALSLLPILKPKWNQ